MQAVLSRHRTLLPIAASVAGITASLLLHTPFGLLVPTTALFLLNNNRAAHVAQKLTHGVSLIGLTGSLLLAALYEGDARAIAMAWAGFFFVSKCIGLLVASQRSSYSQVGASQVPTNSPAIELARPFPVFGPSLLEKAEPRNSTVVSITAQEDKTVSTALTASSFWGGLPLHLRYWRSEGDGRFRWVESRSESVVEPNGTRRWRATTTELDGESVGIAPPTKKALYPTVDDEAVRAAKLIENLIGNAWAFDAAGRPTYLTPLAQTFVAVTLEEFQSAVDEGGTFFRCTAHPDDYERISTAWRLSLRTGEPFYIDRRIRRATGLHEWNRTGFVPTRDSEGRITGWYGTTIDLDSHRITQAELRDRERELLQLVDLVPALIWRLTPEGVPVFFNRRTVDFTGFDITDADRKGISRMQAVLEAVHPEDAVDFEHVLADGLTRGTTFAMRFRLRRSDGVFRWMDFRAEPLRNDRSTIVQWYGAAFDIDDQVRLYSELEDREARIRRLVDSDIIGIVIWDLNGRLIDANDAFLRMVQYDREELKAGLGWLAMTPPEWQEVHAREEAVELANTGKMQPREKEYVRKDGTRVPVLIGAASFAGQSNQGVAYILDLSEQKRADAVLRARERELQDIIDAVPVRIWRAAPNDGPVYFNKRYHDHFRSVIANFDILQQPRISALLQNLVHPDDAPGVTRALNQCFEAGHGEVMRFRWKEEDGTYRWAECRVEPRLDQSGAVAQWYGASIDIDDEVRAQGELRRMQERLAQASQAASLAELSASIAHEVNQPLAAIVANSHACLRWLDADPPNMERAHITVERIIRDANGAADVVSRTRALFKQHPGTRTRCSLPGVIADARRWVDDLASRHGITLDLHVEPGLPLVSIDPVQIQQVLINLMRNAVEAMATSKGPRVLTVSASREKDSIHMKVRDTGVGIQDADKVFEAFYTTKESGMGMGLAVSRNIIESHAGRLWAEHNTDGGASFIFILPLDTRSAA